MALARALDSDGWDVTFASVHGADIAQMAAGGSGVEVVSLDCPPGGAYDAQAVAQLGADLCVVDGYHFRGDFFDGLVHPESSLVLIDDNLETQATTAFAVINQNPSAARLDYAVQLSGPVVLAGLEFALLRPEVTNSAVASRGERIEAVLVSMGGSDVLGLTEPIADALARLDQPTIVALGASVADYERVAARLTSNGVRVIGHHELLGALAECAVAVIAAGSTMWEAAFFGTPTISLRVAANQTAPSIAAAALGMTLSFDAQHERESDLWATAAAALRADPERRAGMARCGRQAVDGDGPKRVAIRLRQLVMERS
jgi:spore coat polysaccharide biosynthesis predicted glycosyltransferase SpsG